MGYKIKLPKFTNQLKSYEIMNLNKAIDNDNASTRFVALMYDERDHCPPRIETKQGLQSKREYRLIRIGH